MALERNALAVFTDSINNLIDSKLILVDGNIATLLKSIAQLPPLTKCLADTLKTSSYVNEFSRARITWTRADGTTETKLKLPTDRNRLFAFVVCLLMEIDSGKRNLIEFLKEYYYDADSNISYMQFVSQVLKPFKRAGETILRSVDPDSLNAEELQRAEDYFFAERIYIGTEVLRELLDRVEHIRSSLNSVKFNNDDFRLECVTMTNALTNALHLKNPRILRIVWIGFKNTLLDFVHLRPYVETIGDIMAQNHII